MIDDKKRLNVFQMKVKVCKEKGLSFNEISPIYKEALVMCKPYGGQCMIDKCMPNKDRQEEGGNGI
jgi:hypothetical protein